MPPHPLGAPHVYYLAMLPGNVGAGAGTGTGTGTTFFETGCVGSSGYFYINIYYKL